MKGMRVQSIIRELRGEKIDIIPYSEETVAFAQKALSPAKVTRVQIVDPESRKLEVIVEDSQLSLAIGKKGQNVRLASKLIGWDIDIKSEEEKRREVEAQFGELAGPADESGDADPAEGADQPPDGGDATGLVEPGVDVEVAGASDTPLPYTLDGIGEKTVRKLVDGGFATLEALGAATAEQLSEIPGIGGKTAEKILAAARGDAPAAGDSSADL
jgi:N utilization substance protein A